MSDEEYVEDAGIPVDEEGAYTGSSDEDWQALVRSASQIKTPMQENLKQGKALLEKLQAEEDNEESEEVDEESAEEEGEDEAAEESEDEDSTEVEAEEEAEDLPVDGLTFKSGDKDIVIPKDAKITVPVDGVPTEITLQDFANGISGQQALQKRFSALDNERRNVERQFKIWEDNVAQYQQIKQTKGRLAGLDYLLATAGMSSKQELNGVLEELAPLLQDYMRLTPEQRAQRNAAAQAERHQLELDAANREAQQLKEQKEAEYRIRQVQSTYNLDDASFAEFYYALESEMQSGTLATRPITPELVGQYKTLREREGWAQQALVEVAPNYAQDPQAVSRLTSMLIEAEKHGHAPNFETMHQLTTEVYGPLANVGKSKDLNQSLKKKGQKALTKSSNIKAPKATPKSTTKNKPRKQSVPFAWMEKYLN